MTKISDIRFTPLHDTHLSLGAKMAPFGGFDMPIQYDGIFSEHHATRKKATLFDTCHMGEFMIEGSGAVETLENLVTCPVASLAIGACRYGLMCDENGGALDDLILYRLATDRFMMVVNAGTQDADYEWITGHAADGTRLTNHSSLLAKIDLQGPESPVVLNALISGASDGLNYFRFRHLAWQGQPIIVSRTGYTGERGYEIYLPADSAVSFWNQAMQHGATPAGLGARDTLRLEAGLPLYGHELTAERNAAHTAFPRTISNEKKFIGADALHTPAAKAFTLAGLQLDGRQSAHPGDAVLSAQGDRIGTVTSGSFAPSLGVAIALAVVPIAFAVENTALQIKTARKGLSAHVVPLPFYAAGTVRKH